MCQGAFCRRGSTVLQLGIRPVLISCTRLPATSRRWRRPRRSRGRSRPGSSAPPSRPRWRRSSRSPCSRSLLELGDPVVGLVGFAALDVAGPGDDRDLPFGSADRLEGAPFAAAAGAAACCAGGAPHATSAIKAVKRQQRGLEWVLRFRIVSDSSRAPRWSFACPCSDPDPGRTALAVFDGGLQPVQETILPRAPGGGKRGARATAGAAGARTTGPRRRSPRGGRTRRRRPGSTPGRADEGARELEHEPERDEAGRRGSSSAG